jgi:hypothetical protein
LRVLWTRLPHVTALTAALAVSVYAPFWLLSSQPRPSASAGSATAPALTIVHAAPAPTLRQTVSREPGRSLAIPPTRLPTIAGSSRRKRERHRAGSHAASTRKPPSRTTRPSRPRTPPSTAPAPAPAISTQPPPPHVASDADAVVAQPGSPSERPGANTTSRQTKHAAKPVEHKQTDHASARPAARRATATSTRAHRGAATSGNRLSSSADSAKSDRTTARSGQKSDSGRRTKARDAKEHDNAQADGRGEANGHDGNQESGGNAGPDRDGGNDHAGQSGGHDNHAGHDDGNGHEGHGREKGKK